MREPRSRRTVLAEIWLDRQTDFERALSQAATAHKSYPVDVRACFSLVRKNTRDLARVYFRIVEAKLRSRSSCRRRGRTRPRFLDWASGAARLVWHSHDVV